MSTVLEQDHFYSVFLYSLWTVLTNSHIRDDELKPDAPNQAFSFYAPDFVGQVNPETMKRKRRTGSQLSVN